MHWSKNLSLIPYVQGRIALLVAMMVNLSEQTPLSFEFHPYGRNRAERHPGLGARHPQQRLGANLL
jgi:hypothetical protein